MRAIAEEKDATILVMVVSGLLAVRGKHEFPGQLWLSVYLGIRHQRLACTLGELASHVVRVTDLPFGERHGVGQGLVAAAGADEEL